MIKIEKKNPLHSANTSNSQICVKQLSCGDGEVTVSRSYGCLAQFV
jgi:hypothetical protein